MVLEKFQELLKNNTHGMLFGAIAAILVFLIRNVTDPQTQVGILLASMFIGVFITNRFKIQRGKLTEKVVLLIAGLIITLSFVGIETGLFAISSFGKFTKVIFGRAIGVTLFSTFLSSFSLLLGIIALIAGLFILGIPFAGLINTITDNFILVVIIAGIVAVAAIVLKK